MKMLGDISIHLLKHDDISFHLHLRYIVLEVAKIGGDSRPELPEGLWGVEIDEFWSVVQKKRDS
jgi:hypothetical protein